MMPPSVVNMNFSLQIAVIKVALGVQNTEITEDSVKDLERSVHFIDLSLLYIT